MATEKGGFNLTPREAGLMAAAMKYGEGDPTVNWDLAAKFAGYSNVKTARDTWCRLKKRIKEAAGSDENSNAPVGGIDKTSPTKRSPAKPKKAAPDGDSPNKPKRTQKKKVHKTGEVHEEAVEASGGNGEVKAEPEDDGALG